jgi:hypothetical protein
VSMPIALLAWSMRVRVVSRAPCIPAGPWAKVIAK